MTELTALSVLGPADWHARASPPHADPRRTKRKELRPYAHAPELDTPMAALAGALQRSARAASPSSLAIAVGGLLLAACSSSPRPTATTESRRHHHGGRRRCRVWRTGRRSRCRCRRRDRACCTRCSTCGSPQIQSSGRSVTVHDGVDRIGHRGLDGRRRGPPTSAHPTPTCPPAQVTSSTRPREHPAGHLGPAWSTTTSPAVTAPHQARRAR